MLRSGRLFGCREMPFVQLRQLLVKKFHLPGGEAQKPGPKTPEDFAEEFFKIIYSMGGMLTSVEASETPTRSYIVDISEQDRNALLNKKADERIMSDGMDAVLDEIIK